MRLVKESDELFQGVDAWRMFKWILALLLLISGCFSISVVGFLRKDFGERYYGLVNLAFGYTIVANFAFFGNLVGIAAGGSFSWLATLGWLGFIGASIYHRWAIHKKNKAGLDWHSQCHGTSLLPLPCSEETVFKAWEPALVFLTGLLCWKVSGQLSLWLLISGIALLVSNHLVFHFERQKFLDARDAGIEARNMGKALQGKPARETGGFVIAASTVQICRHDAGLRDAFARMSPDVKRMFDGEPDFGGAAA